MRTDVGNQHRSLASLALGGYLCGSLYPAVSSLDLGTVTNSPVMDSQPSQPTLDDAKSRVRTSRVREILISGCGGLAQIAKLLKPALDGTPFKAPLEIFVAIADVIEVSTCMLSDVGLTV